MLADEYILIILSLSAVVPADGILFGFLLLTSSTYFQSAAVPGWTFNEYQHSSKPCPLPAIIQRHSTNMKHLITNITTYIQDREQCIAFQIEGQEESIKAQFKVVKKLVGQISILEIEILLNSFCEPSSFFKKGETMPDGRKAFDETKFPKTWKITLDGTLDELRIKNQSYLLNFQTIYDTHIFEKENKQLAVRVRTTQNNIYFYQLDSFERIVGIKQNEFNLLRGGFVSPVMYKKGDYSDYFGKFTPIKEDDKIVADFNFRVDETIDNNFNLYGDQELENEEDYSDNQRYEGDDDDDDSYKPSYEKYNGYNGWDDDTIDQAFDGDPEATWNVD